MERFLVIIRNKYLLAGLAFVLWMCFFDRYDLGTQISYSQEEQKLEQERDFYVDELQLMEVAIKDAQFNPNAIQRIAREKYKMKKDNEDIYVITEVEPIKK